MWPNFLNSLSWWQWLILAAVPPAIILLYFLKLKRQPLEVPSTYLWLKSIEDLHVNSIWQRLRNNLLLWLQLLLLLLLMLALLRPYWHSKRLSGDRFIFLIDNSASMRATDVGPSRLEEAKRLAGKLIDGMAAGEAAMIISFADSAKVEQTFTENRRQLKRSLAAIEPTQRPTDLTEALKVASGLANPGRSAEDITDYQVAEAMPATLFIFSDGNFKDVQDFRLGHLDPTFIEIGEQQAANVGITSFSIRPKESNPAVLEGFAQVENFGSEQVSGEAVLYLDGKLWDARNFSIGKESVLGLPLDVGDIDTGVLELRIVAGDDSALDDLALDDAAYRVINPPRPANILLVTPGNEPLEFALITKSTMKIANIQVKTPADLKTEAYAKAAEAETWDLVIYDRCAPEKMPQANTLFIGSLPPGDAWVAEEKVEVPGIIDIEAGHPLMQWLDLGDVLILSATPLKLPPGGVALIDTEPGAVMAIAPRRQFEDVVMGFTIIDELPGADGKTSRYIGTNWMTRQSFPVFILNLIDYLGGTGELAEAGNLRPGKPVVLEAPKPKAKLRVSRPGSAAITLRTDESGKANFAQTGELGVYRVQSAGETLQQFTVNLFDSQESGIRPKDFAIGNVDLQSQKAWEATRHEGWKWIVLIGLGVLLLEWFVYNRRVSL